MSSNFLNTAGGFSGVDMHLYLSLGIPPAIPFPMVVPHYASQIHWVGLAANKATTVTMTCAEALQKGWQMILVPHVFLTFAPPHPTEWANLARIFFLSSSEPKLSASTVWAQGAPILVEDIEAIGLNVDCSDTWLGFGADINPNTVKTTPTPGDYAFAIFWTAAATLWKARKSKADVVDDALAPFKGRHRKGDPMQTVNDAVRRQVRSDMRGIVEEQGKDLLKDQLTDALKPYLRDGFIEDNVSEAISTFF